MAPPTELVRISADLSKKAADELSWLVHHEDKTKRALLEKMIRAEYERRWADLTGCGCKAFEKGKEEGAAQ